MSDHKIPVCPNKRLEDNIRRYYMGEITALQFVLLVDGDNFLSTCGHYRLIPDEDYAREYAKEFIIEFFDFPHMLEQLSGCDWRDDFDLKQEEEWRESEKAFDRQKTIEKEMLENFSRIFFEEAQMVKDPLRLQSIYNQYNEEVELINDFIPLPAVERRWSEFLRLINHTHNIPSIVDRSMFVSEDKANGKIAEVVSYVEHPKLYVPVEVYFVLEPVMLTSLCCEDHEGFAKFVAEAKPESKWVDGPYYFSSKVEAEAFCRGVTHSLPDSDRCEVWPLMSANLSDRIPISIIKSRL